MLTDDVDVDWGGGDGITAGSGNEPVRSVCVCR